MLLALLFATVIRGPADVETLARESDVVVHGSVAKTEAVAANGLIHTRVTLTVAETWKGAPAKSLVVMLEGGCAGELCQDVSGAATARRGDELVLFLKERARGVFTVSRMALGKFAVGAAAKSLPKRALRDRTGISCVGCGADEEDDLSLDDLRARVLRSAR